MVNFPLFSIQPRTQTFSRAFLPHWHDEALIIAKRLHGRLPCCVHSIVYNNKELWFLLFLLFYKRRRLDFLALFFSKTKYKSVKHSVNEVKKLNKSIITTSEDFRL